jgi:hypothetical protein
VTGKVKFPQIFGVFDLRVVAPRARGNDPVQAPAFSLSDIAGGLRKTDGQVNIRVKQTTDARGIRILALPMQGSQKG